MELNSKKIFLICTEPSGDLLGSDLIAKIEKRFKNFEIVGIGGEKMNESNFSSLLDTNGMNVNGIIEVLIKFSFFLKFFNKTIKSILKIDPDIVVTIDSPSFNYRVVKKLQFLRPKTKFVHIVAPTVWAWKRYRAKSFAKNYDLILTLFDFEPKYFQKYNKNAFCIGHPIFKEKHIVSPKKNLITFLPGSRLNEIEYILPKMILIFKKLKILYSEYDFKIVTLPFLEDKVSKLVKNEKIKIISSKYDKDLALKETKLAIASSGTVILELANKFTPTIVVYNSNLLTSFILKYLVNLKWANLVNIILKKNVLPEFLFSKFKVDEVINSAEQIIGSKKLQQKQIDSFLILKKKMTINRRDPMDLAIDYIKRKL